MQVTIYQISENDALLCSPQVTTVCKRLVCITSDHNLKGSFIQILAGNSHDLN